MPILLKYRRYFTRTRCRVFQPAEGVILWQKATNVRFICRNWYYYKLRSNLKAKGGRKKVYTAGNFFDKLLFSQDFTPAMISAFFSCELLQRLDRTCMIVNAALWKKNESIEKILWLLYALSKVYRTLCLWLKWEITTHISPKAPSDLR